MLPMCRGAMRQVLVKLTTEMFFASWASLAILITSVWNSFRLVMLCLSSALPANSRKNISPRAGRWPRRRREESVCYGWRVHAVVFVRESVDHVRGADGAC